MRKINPAYIGADNLDKLDYPEMEVSLGNIRSFASPKPKEYLLSNDSIGLYGIKFEVETKKTSVNYGKIMLFGFCEYNPITKKTGYHHIYRGKDGVTHMIEMLKSIIKDCSFNNKIICHFGVTEAIHIIKVLMEYKQLSAMKITSISQRILKGINGKYNKKSKSWSIEPLVCVDLGNGESIGVSKVLKGNLELFVSKGKTMYTCRTFDSKVFWQSTPKECAKKANLKYADEIHDKEEFVNWDLFESKYVKNLDSHRHKEQENHYVKKVLKQNGFRSFLAKDLIKVVNRMYHNTFEMFPKSFYSAGSLAEAIISQYISDEVVKAFSIGNLMDEWELNGIDVDTISKTFHMSIDSNQGAIIEHEKVGYVRYGANTDISASYPAIMRYALPDLRDSKPEYRSDIKKWDDVPKADLNKVVLITCEFDIPEHVRHTLLVRMDGVNNKQGGTNEIRKSVRGYGNFVATAHYHEIKFLLSQLTEEEKEKVIVDIKEVLIIHTTGKKHPIAKIIEHLWDLRLKLRAIFDDSEYIVKLIMNAIYGKFFQSIKEYEAITNEDGEQEITYLGFKAGSMFNPVISSLITAFGRIRVQEGALNIEKNGGEVVAILTDCIKYSIEDETKEPTDLFDQQFPSVLEEFEGLQINGWTPKGMKTLGMFEEPEYFINGVFLTTAVYEYRLNGDKWEVKTSGYQTFDKDHEEDSYLMKKIEHFIKNPHEHFFKYGSLAGDYGLKLGKEQLVGFYHIAEGKESFEELGLSRWEHIPLIFDKYKLLPKRRYEAEDNNDLELNLTTVKDNLFQTRAIDISELGFYEDDDFENWITFDNRNLKVRELAILPTREVIQDKKKEEKSKRNIELKANKRELLKLLHKQITDNIDKFEFEKFTMKEKSNNGYNARDFGIEGMRNLLLSVGITPTI